MSSPGFDTVPSSRRNTRRLRIGFQTLLK
jgi:hypothetical protein